MPRRSRAALLALSLFLTGACLAASVFPSSPESLGGGKNRDKGRGAFIEAVRLVAGGEPGAARPKLQESLALYGELRDYQLAYLARVEAALGHGQSARKLYSEVVEHYPQSVWRPEALLGLAQLAFSAGNNGRARRWAAAAARAAGASDQTRLAARMLILRQTETANPRRAYDAYRDLRVAGPKEVAAAARARQEVLRTRHPNLFAHPSLAARIGEAEARLAEGDAAGALEILRAAASARENHPLQAKRELLIARATAAIEGPRAAAELYERVWNNYPNSDPAPAALYQLAYAFWNGHQDSQAAPLFARLVKNYPSHSRADRALYALGRIAEEAGRFEAALERYRTLARAARSAPLREESAWRMGWVYYLAGNYEAASRRFAQAGKGTKGELLASLLYWQARAAEKLERERGLAQVPSSRASYCRVITTEPNSYYAGLSEARLAATRGPSAPAKAETARLPAQLLPRYSFHLDRSRELAKINLRQFASRELAAVEREARENRESELVLPYLMAAYSEIGDHARSARAALSSRPAQAELNWLDSPAAGYAYPLAYWELTVQEAQRTAVDPCLALAVMRQESFFDRRAVSPADAVGLMQLLPRTARKVASRDRRPGSAAVSRKALFEPSVNLRLGITYLAQLLALARGSLPRALAAYNAGEDALADWEARYPGAEEDEFVERISYPETRSYVKKVLANLRVYRHLYGDSACRSQSPDKIARSASGHATRPVAEICK